MKPKNLEPIKHSLEVEDRQESCPVTPINRFFPSSLDPAFATAILSPSSNEVFAARTRARSRSEAFLMRNEEECLPTLSTVKKPKLMVNLNECASKDKFDESSIEHSMEEMDFSMSRMKVETPDTSQESFSKSEESVESKNTGTSMQANVLRRTSSTLCQDNAMQQLSLNSQNRLLKMRKKSNTISIPADKVPKFQDVFGPKLALEDKIHSQQMLTNAERGGKTRPSHPRRMTIGGPASVLRSAFSTVKSSDKLRQKPSLRSVAECAILESSTDQVSMASVSNNAKANESLSKCFPDSLQDSDPNDESCIVFQHLIQGLSRERSIHSGVLSEMHPVADQSINAVMEYRSTSPTEKENKRVSGPPCDLCGAIALRMTVLEPCQHLACAACCSSGLNQVTATPPRPHVCAACHTPVKGINLRKSSISEHSQSNRLSSGGIYPAGGVQRLRTRTPSHDGQGLFYLQGNITSSPLTAWSHRLSFNDSFSKCDLEKSQGYPMLRSSTPDQGYLGLTGIVDSSDPATEDASFFVVDQEFSYSTTPRNNFGRADTSKINAPIMFDIPTTQNMQEVFESYRTTVVVRLDNIPWKLTYNDVLQWLPDKAEKMLPDADKVAQAVHIPIDIVSGKTANCCFVECRDKTEAMRFVRHRNNSRLLGRPVSLILTTHEDLLNEIFPFRLMSPRKDEEHCIYFTPGILAQIVQLLKLGSLQLKGPVKVVDLATSMVRLVPAMLNEKLRDILFERTKEIICTCIIASNELAGIHESLNRLLLASSTCACFTVDQRIDILENARRALNAVAVHY